MKSLPRAYGPIAGLLLVLAAPALADPPSHAPAHGWRKKHDPYYQGYTGRKWADDYGVMGGRCDAQRLATALGEVGAELGQAVGGEKGEIVGTIAGVLIGSRMERRVDVVDRGCLSHALDIGEADRPVSWSNPHTREDYRVTPRAPRTVDGRVCRDLDWSTGVRQTACLDAGGGWTIVVR